MPARRVVAIAVSAVALGGLTGCEEPTPLVTVVSGSASVHREAAIYCREGQSVDRHTCATGTTKASDIAVRPGDVVGIDVGRELADSGWFIAIGNQRSEIQKDHYYRFTPGPGDFGQGNRIELQVVSINASGAESRNTGIWPFTLTMKN